MAERRSALVGIRVIDLSHQAAGPWCTSLLGDLGADVIKVEKPGRGDGIRYADRTGRLPPEIGGLNFQGLNRNKRGLTIDIGQEAGCALVRRLVAQSDVLVENFRPGTMERLGVGFKALSRLNRRLVYCSISGFGESGPEAHRAGYDLIVQGEGGIMDITGFSDGPPVKVGNSIGDLVAGMAAAHGIVLALLARTRTRRGQKVEIGMLDVMASLLTYQAGTYFNTGAKPSRRGNQHPSIVPYEVFKASDAYLTLGVANNSLWKQCCAALERPELANDPRFDTEAKRVEHRATLVPLLNEIFGARDADEWLKRLEAAGVPAGRIKTVAEVCESDHLKARGMVVRLRHPKAGHVTVMGVPIRLHTTPGAAATAPPLLGQHTTAVLRGVLGLKAAALTRLRRDGVV
jgi:crotonobetainyl-CoA:carnitine CoA-transferase CaiB-like acyl-CoA transferase